MAVGAGDFGADVGADAGFVGGHVEAGGAVRPSRSMRAIAGMRLGAGRPLFGWRAAFEEAKVGASVELDVGRAIHSPFVLPVTQIMQQVRKRSQIRLSLQCGPYLFRRVRGKYGIGRT